MFVTLALHGINMSLVKHINLKLIVTKLKDVLGVKMKIITIIFAINHNQLWPFMKIFLYGLLITVIKFFVIFKDYVPNMYRVIIVEKMMICILNLRDV